MRGRCSPIGYSARYLASVALAAMLAAGLGGCQTMSDVAGSLTSKADPVPDDPRRAVEVYGERYRANPRDANAALAYGEALRATGQRAQACSAPMAARSLTTAIRRQLLTC